MLFREFVEIDTITERGKRITNEAMYNNFGEIKVISSKIDGCFGYICEEYLNLPINTNAKQYIDENTFVYAIEGNAGYVSLYTPQMIWLSDVSGLFDVKKKYIDMYGKDLIAIFLQYFFIKNRHNTGTQPKFLIKNILNKKIDMNVLTQLSKIDLSEVDIEDNIYSRVKTNYNELLIKNDTNKIILKDFVDGYIERGTRLVIGRDLYLDYGNIKAISSTTTGPMGYYNKSNYDLKENDFLYSIDGANAGYISLYHPQSIFITDHAGVISVKEEYVKRYGKLSIALFLQDYFIKQTSKGTQPTFLLKNNLNLEMDLNILEVLSSMELDNCI